MANDPPPSAKNTRRGRLARWALLGAAATALCVAFPPIRITRLSASAPALSQSRGAGSIEADLAAAAAHAADIRAVIDAGDNDLASAKKKYGREVGIGGPCYFLVAGKGIILRKEAAEIGLSLNGRADAEVVFDVGPLFGNAIRDGTGAFDVNAGGNSRDFNALSEQLNAHVEKQIFPKLGDQAKVGSQIRFTGVAEVASDATSLKPLRLVPISLEIH